MSEVKYVKISKVFTAMFALVLVYPDRHFSCPFALGFCLLTVLGPVFILGAIAYFGLITYFFISGIKDLKKMWDSIITVIAICVSYVLIATIFGRFLKYGDVAIWTLLILYLSASFVTLFLTIKRIYYGLIR